MIDQPLVSVVIPAYNHSRYVESAIMSVVDQTYANIELIVIDDGSTDLTAEICRNALTQCPFESRLASRPNAGAAATLNEGISIARGEYVTFLNSDDFYERERIAICVDEARRSKSELVFTGVNFVDDYGRDAAKSVYLLSLHDALRRKDQAATLGFALLENQLAISTGNFFATKRLCRKIEGFRHYQYVHDWDFILRSLFFNEPLCIKDELYNYRLHGTNSFKTLQGLAGYETSEVMRNFFWMMTSKLPINRLAPSPFYWPGVFERWVRAKNYHIYLPPRYQFGFTESEWLS